jgi:hypothetical protein
LLLDKTILEAELALDFANYVYHRTDLPTPGGGTAILVHKGIDHKAVPVSGLQYLQATAIHLVLGTGPVKLLSAYLAPTRPSIESDVTECLSRGIPALMVGDLNDKHMDWNSELIAANGSLFRDYSHRNSYFFIYGPDFPTTAPYTQKDIADILDIVVKDFVLPVHLTAQHSAHITCRSSLTPRVHHPFTTYRTAST